MTNKARIAAVLSLALLAACGAGGVTTTDVDYDTYYSLREIGYAAGGRDLAVVIRGNPTPAPQEAFERAVIAAMQGKNSGVPMREMARRLDVIDVTEFVVTRTAEHLARTPRERAERPVPVLCKVKGVRRIFDE